MSTSPSPETSPDRSTTSNMAMTFMDKASPQKSYTEPETRSDTDDDRHLVLVAPELLNKRGIFLLNVAWFGLSLMFLLLSVEVIPTQIQSLVGPAAKGRWLGGMVAAGAALTFFASPLIGMQSDRSTFQVGRRRPVMVIGAIGLCIGLIGMAVSSPEISMAQLSRGDENATGEAACNQDLLELRCMPYWNASVSNPIDRHKEGAQHPGSIVLQGRDGRLKTITVPIEQETDGNIALYIIFYLIVTMAFATVVVPYNALIADKSHPSQRGLSSGVMAAAILVGNVSGAAVGTSFTSIGVIGVYSISISVVIVTLFVTVYSTTEDVAKTIVEPVSCVSIFCGFLEPLKEHDFRWVFITRFLMQQGVATTTGFLEYWLHDMVYLPNCWTAATCVALMLLPMLFAAAVSAVIFGILSDKTGRRKPIVIAAAGLMCVSMTILTVISGPSAFYLAIGGACIFGVGFGSFQSVDFALVMDVLPEEGEKAKDIAVWHQALILPNALATPIGGFILDYFQSVDCELGLGYIILFVVTSLYFCLSGLFVLKIRSSR